MVAQEEEDFGKQASVELFVTDSSRAGTPRSPGRGSGCCEGQAKFRHRVLLFLELHFDKVDGLLRGILRRYKHAVDAKGGLLDFN